MEGFKKKWKEFVYSFSTEDRYAEYNPKESAAGPSASMAAAGLATDSANASTTNLTSQGSNGIQLNDFVDGGELGGNDGVSETLLAWKHIDSWASEHNPDLLATFSDPCTRNDINNAEKDLSITFPASVRASLRIHDGQEDLESMTGTSGLIYGLQLMPLDQIVSMTQTWRNVAENLMKKREQLLQREASAAASSQLKGSTVDLPNTSVTPQALKTKGYGKLETQDYRSMNPNLQRNISQNYDKQFKMPNIPRQNSVPPEAVHPVYAHPGWIPLVTDNAGNHIGVDLSPGPSGKYAQVILFGRDFDTKFVVADNWGDFLLSFANDLEKGNWYLVDEENDYFGGEGELVFRDKESKGPVMDYLDVLKRRSWLKWQAKLAKERKQDTNKSVDKEERNTPHLKGSPSPVAHETTLIEVETSKEDSPGPVKEDKETEAEEPKSEETADAAGTLNEDTQENPETELEDDSAKKSAASEDLTQVQSEEESKPQGVKDSKDDGKAEESASVDKLKDEFENVAL